MPNDPSKQLAISFEQDPLLTDGLAKGEHCTFIELALPEEKIHWDAPRNIIRSFSENEHQVNGFVIRHSIRTAITDLAPLKQLTPLPFLLALPGQRADSRQIREDTAAAASIGIRNILAVTGNIDPDHKPEDDGSYSRFGAGYIDSLDALTALYAPVKTQVLAATVNPHKYQPETILAQYAKMLAKIESGASVLVVQAGWDMKKFQELQWLLQLRETLLPLIARIRLVSPETAQCLHLTLEPGVSFPVPIAAKLMRLAQEPKRFQEYLVALAALQAVGLMKLGFAGVLLAGTSDADLLSKTLEAIGALNHDIASYNEWLARWDAFHEGFALTPSGEHDAGTPYYLFDNLLQKDLPFFTPGISKFSRMEISRPPRMLELKTALLAPGSQGLLSALAKRLARPDDSLAACYGLDNASCPKRLVKGPCGNARPDGYCEAGHAPCFFNLIAQLALERGDLAIFGD